MGGEMNKKLIILFITAGFLFYACSEDSVGPEIDSVQEVIESIDINSLSTYVKTLSGLQSFNYNGTETYIETRNWALEGNAIAADYIASTLAGFGLEVVDQPFDSLGRNVLGIHRGTLFPDQYYIICAHYDDCGVLHCIPDSSQLAPGADDNASGTAAVLEAARILSNYPSRYSLIFALWDEEERGLYGSLHYAENARNNNMSIMGVINLDMIGWNSDADHKAHIIVWDTENIPELGWKTTEINDDYDIGLNLEFIYRDRGSDFISFWINEYPAISIIEDYGDFNTGYHSINDTFDNMDQTYFLKMSKLAIGMFADYAFNEQN